MNKKKRINVSGQGIKTIKSDKAVITENAHAPIVTEEVFKAVSKNRNYGKTKRKNIHLFTGKIRCKVCGYTLCANNKKNTGYECRVSKGYSERKCYSGIIEESYIEKTVKGMINKLIKKNEKANRLLEKPNQDKDYIQLIDSLEKKIVRLKNKKFDLFEDYIRKDMSDDEYIERNTKLELEISKIEEEIVLYKIQYDEYKEECKSYEELKSIKKLTREIIDKFIDVILVDANGKLEIKWKF